MGSLASPIKRIERIDFRPLKTEAVKGIKAMTGNGSYGSPRLIITHEPFVIYTDGGLGGKIHLSDSTHSYLKGLERLGVITKQESKAHRDEHRARAKYRDIYDLRTAFRRIAQKCGIELTSKQTAQLTKGPGALDKEWKAASERARAIPDRNDWP